MNIPPQARQIVCLLVFAISGSLFALNFEKSNVFANTDGIFVTNRQQIREVSGESADSIVAFCRMKGNYAFLTNHSLIFAIKRGETYRRCGIYLPAMFLPSLVPPAESLLHEGIRATGEPETVRKAIRYRDAVRGCEIAISAAKGAFSISVSSTSRETISELRFGLESIVRKFDGSRYSLWVDSASVPLLIEEFTSENNIQSGIGSPICDGAIYCPFQAVLSNGAMLEPGTVPIVATIHLRFASYLGSSGNDSILCATKTTDGIILCGSTNSPSFPCTPGASQPGLRGFRDAWIGLFDESMNPKWITLFGGNGEDVATSCASRGSVVAITGTTTSTDLGRPGTLQASFGGGMSDGFVATINVSDGRTTGCTYVGGSDLDRLLSVTILPSNDIGVCGTTISTDFRFSGHQSMLSGGSDAFVAVLTSDLSSQKWGSYYGGRADEDGVCVTSLNDGSIVIGGNTSSPNSGFKIAENVGQGSAPPGGLQTSGFVARFTPTGQRLWGRFLGGDSFDTITTILSKDDEIYVGGYTSSQSGIQYSFISSGSAQSSSGSGLHDGFVSKLRSDGVLTWGTYIGGSNDDRVYALHVTPTSDVIACGTTSSSNFPRFDSDQAELAGGYDAFATYVLKNGRSFGGSLIIGGSKDEGASGIAFLSDRSVLISGTTNSPDFPFKSGPQSELSGGSDAFIAIFDPMYTVDINLPEENPLTRVFPQPATGTVTVSTSCSMFSPSLLTCFSSDGTMVYRKILTETMNTYSISIEGLTYGMYTLVWSDGSTTISKPFINLRP